MHVFKLSVVAGPANFRYPPGTELEAICMVDLDEVEAARDRALLELNRQGWASCTFRNVARMAADANAAAFNTHMREAYDEAKRTGAALIVYPGAVGAA